MSQEYYKEFYPAFTSDTVTRCLDSLMATLQLQMQGAIKGDTPTLETAARNIRVGHQFSTALLESFVENQVDLASMGQGILQSLLLFGSDHTTLGMMLCAMAGVDEYDKVLAKKIYEEHRNLDFKALANGNIDRIDMVIWLFNIGAGSLDFLVKSELRRLAHQRGWTEEDTLKVQGLLH